MPNVFADYDALIAAPDVDAIYNPLPNGLHAQWTTAALEAGKHVLCEKPLTANAAEAEQLAAVAQRTGLVLMEAFHWRYHPLAQRMVEIVRSGELGSLRHVEAALCFPLPRFSDIRYQYDLAGGALMDAGCYTVHIVRTLGGEEPEVVRATPKLHTPDVDRAMRAELRFPSGHTGTISCSMWSTSLLRLHAGAGRRPRRDARVQPDDPAALPPLESHRRRPESSGALAAKTDVRVPARGVLRGGAARRRHADAAVRLDREHARHRRDLPGRGHEGARYLSVPASDLPERSHTEADLRSEIGPERPVGARAVERQ